MKISLEDLGFTREELKEKVIDNVVSSLLYRRNEDEGEHEFTGASMFKAEIEKKVKETIEAEIAALFKQHLAPSVKEFVQNLVLTETNGWGEKTGKKLTFTEYLVARADAYMREDVDYNGRSKAEGDYNWSKKTSRVTHLVHDHLKYSIESAMKTAITNANKSIEGGLEGAIKHALQEVTGKIKVTTGI